MEFLNETIWTICTWDVCNPFIKIIDHKAHGQENVNLLAFDGKSGLTIEQEIQ